MNGVAVPFEVSQCCLVAFDFAAEQIPMLIFIMVSNDLFKIFLIFRLTCSL